MTALRLPGQGVLKERTIVRSFVFRAAGAGAFCQMVPEDFSLIRLIPSFLISDFSFLISPRGIIYWL